MRRGYSSRTVVLGRGAKRSADTREHEREKRSKIRREIYKMSRSELDSSEIEEIRELVLRGMYHRF